MVAMKDPLSTSPFPNGSAGASSACGVVALVSQAALSRGNIQLPGLFRTILQYSAWQEPAKREDARDRSLWRLQSNELAGYSNHASSRSASVCGSESSRIQHPPARPTVSAGVAPDPRPTTAPSDGVFEPPRISHPWLRRKRVLGSPRILHLRQSR
jgi:hypothetical protein